jgi:hypothetical protein
MSRKDNVTLTLNPMQVGVLKQALARESDHVRHMVDEDIKPAERAAWVNEIDDIQDMLP